MTENTQPPKLKWKDKEYEQSSLTDQQKYLFAQLVDIEKKENNAKFVLDQILASKQVFSEKLDKEMTKWVWLTHGKLHLYKPKMK